MELLDISDKIDGLSEKINKLALAKQPPPLWFDLKAACEFKGLQYNTVRCQSALQPRRGVPDAEMGKKKYWNRDTVLNWARQFEPTKN